jgi:hypothetical protein
MKKESFKSDGKKFHQYQHYLDVSRLHCSLRWLVELLGLTPLSTIFQLYRGGQFYWWGKPEYPEKTTGTMFRSQTGCEPIGTQNVSSCCFLYDTAVLPIYSYLRLLIYSRKGPRCTCQCRHYNN